MSLIHTKVATIPDDPSYEVGKDEWNEEHKFPGAGAGEVVFVDGSGHAATNAGFKFDGTSMVLNDATTISGDNSSAALTQDQDAYGGSSLDIKTVGSLGSVGNPIKLTAGASDFTGAVTVEMQLDTGGGEAKFSIAAGIDTNNNGWGIYPALLGNGAWYPKAANVQDLGGVGFEVRTGYFGTSVVSPLFSVASGAGNSGISTTITSASLVGKTITIQGGIITGFA